MKEQAAKPQNSRPLTVDEKEELKKGLMTILNDVEFGTPTIKMGPPPDKKAEVKDNEDN